MYEEYSIPLAILMMRIWLGATILLQAIDKIFILGIHNVADAFEFKISHFHLSQSFYWFFTGLTSWFEFTAAILLLLGIFKILAFTLLGFDMLIISVAFSLNSPMWNMRHFFPRFLILIILMFIPSVRDWFSIDYMLIK